MLGNIGTAASEVANQASGDEWIVTELSSFQLMGTYQFRPKIGLLLNVFDAHLDYHHSRKNYELAKQQVYRNQSETDVAVVNLDDETVVRLAECSKAEKVYFSVRRTLERGACVKDGAIMFNGEPVMPLEDVVLPGSINLENILAALCIVKTAGVSDEAVRKVLTSFTGVKHRMQYVATIKDRLFYNDSKATNILATKKALSAFQKPVILLAGGLDRGNEFDELKPHMSLVKAGDHISARPHRSLRSWPKKWEYNRLNVSIMLNKQQLRRLACQTKEMSFSVLGLCKLGSVQNI